MVRILHTHHHPVVEVVVIINIVNHRQVAEAIMAVTAVTVPVVAKTTISHKVRVIRLMAVEVLEIVAAAIIIAVMVMEVEVEVEVEAVEVIAVIVLVEAMVEVKEEAVAVDMEIVGDTVTALAVVTTVAVAVVVITKGATVTVVVAMMGWLHKKIQFLYLVWILQFRKKKFVNILEPLVLLNMTSVQENPKYGCTKIKTLVNRKAKLPLLMMIRMLHVLR